jgi:hypothetical protein
MNPQRTVVIIYVMIRVIAIDPDGKFGLVLDIIIHDAF